jgi:hypothetical protein
LSFVRAGVGSPCWPGPVTARTFPSQPCCAPAGHSSLARSTTGRSRTSSLVRLSRTPASMPVTATGPTSVENPHSRTMWVARSVAPAKSFEAPLEGSPRTRDLRGAPGEAHGEGVGEVALGVEVALGEGELLGDPEGGTAGQDRDLGHRVGVLGEERHEGVAGLVDGDRVLLVGQQRVRHVSPADQEPVACRVEVGRGDDGAARPHRVDRRLVDEVGQVGARSPACPATRRRGRRAGRASWSSNGWRGWPWVPSGWEGGSRRSGRSAPVAGARRRGSRPGWWRP